MSEEQVWQAVQARWDAECDEHDRMVAAQKLRANTVAVAEIKAVGAREERARIVAWMRRMAAVEAEGGEIHAAGRAFAGIADDVERCEHLKDVAEGSRT